MLALKLLLVPAFLGLLTLVARWLGPAVAGWLAGLPLVAGPIVLILALEQGAALLWHGDSPGGPVQHHRQGRQEHL
ncbi:MAG: hypothetical protein J0M00_25385 [Burkholderiales bacterium]|nr:hypothetical protein [Burkholderiales bacterium]